MSKLTITPLQFHKPTPKDLWGVISHKPVSREFAREWQFNGLPTTRQTGLVPSG